MMSFILSWLVVGMLSGAYLDYLFNKKVSLGGVVGGAAWGYIALFMLGYVLSEKYKDVTIYKKKNKNGKE